MVNPDDIESISVLKDAASASIYGAKAAFGVVLITTKKGAKTDKVNVSYQGNLSFQNMAKEMKMGQLNALEYSVEAMKRSGKTVTGGISFYMTESGLERAREWQNKYGGKLGPDDPYVYGRDWYVDANGRNIGLRTFDPYDYMVREWAPTHSHNVSINGKSGKTTYNIGLGYLHQNGMMKPAKKDDFTRYNASVRLSTEINKYLTVRAGSIFSSRDKRYPYATSSTTADPWLYLYRWGPNMPLGVNEDGNDLRSPWSETKQANTASQVDNYLNISLGTTVNVTKDWKFDFDYTYASETGVIKRPGTRYSAANAWMAGTLKTDAAGNQIYVNDLGQQVAATAEGAMPAYELPYQEYTAHGANPDHIYRKSSGARRHTFNATTDYNWQLNDDNNFKFLLGMNLVTYDYEDNWSQITDLTDITNPQFDLAVGTQTASGNQKWEGQMGYFGRINYNYKEKYLLEANFRADASSRFAKGYRWGYFPSFSAGWRISEEDFMENTRGWLQSLKFRGSWGLLGNQDAVKDEYYPYLPTLYIGKNFPFGGTVHQGITVVSHKVTTISWENSTNWGIGFDANFLNEFMLSVEYYNRKTSDIIMDIPVSDTFGISGTYQDNKGSLRNSGVEASFAWNHSFNKDWIMGVNANFSYNKNELLDLAGVNEIIDGYTINRIGEPYQSFYVYEVDGLFQSDEEAAAYEKQYGNPWSLPFKGGDFRIKDADGDGKLTDKDRVVKGTQQPKTTFGLTLSAGWKNFDLSVFMQGVTGTNRYFSRDVVGSFIGDTSHPSTNWLDAWTPENTNAEWPRLFLEENSISSPQRVNSSFWCMNTNYLRIKNVNFGYTLPKTWTSKLGIANAKIYYTGENLFTFDSLPFNADPESPSGNLDVYPISRSHSFGINVTF